MPTSSDSLKKVLSAAESKSSRLNNVRKAVEGLTNIPSKTRSTAGDNSNVNPMNGPIAGLHKALGK